MRCLIISLCSSGGIGCSGPITRSGVEGAGVGDGAAAAGTAGGGGIPARTLGLGGGGAGSGKEFLDWRPTPFPLPRERFGA